MGKYIEKLKSKVKVGKDVFIAPNATLVGDRTNIQDGVIFHTDPGVTITVGEENIIGHGAIIHGCTIGNNNLIGIRATILNGAKIGNCCIIGAHALVTENMDVPDYSMVLGVPGKVVKTLPPEAIERMKLGAAFYVHEAMQYLAE
jgi:carbonic anhydrase/acetyltransferase-like protein (isoleucine patch superfamily)